MKRYTASTTDDFRHALAATLAWLGLGAILDVYLLIARKEVLISDIMRTGPGFTVLMVFLMHVVNVLGRFDPFRAAAGVVDSRLIRVDVKNSSGFVVPSKSAELTEVYPLIK